MNTLASWAPRTPSHQSEPSSPSNYRTTSRLQSKLLKVVSTSAERSSKESSNPFLNALSPDRPIKIGFSSTFYSPSSPMRVLDSDTNGFSSHTPIVKKVGSPLIPPLRSNSNLAIRIPPGSKESSPDSSMITGSTNIAGKIKSKGTFGDRIEEMKGKKHKSEIKTLDVESNSVSPRTIGERYDYKAQHLTFIPEHMAAAMNKTSFLKFNDLAKTMNSTHQALLGSIVMEDSQGKEQELEHGQGHGNGQIQSGNDSRRLQTIKKVLEFNKLQKDCYDVEIYRQQKELMLPLVKREYDRQVMKKHMKSLKVSPSIPTPTQAFGWDSMIMSSLVIDSVNQSATTINELKQGKDGKEKKGKNGKKEDRNSELLEIANAMKASFRFKFFWYPTEQRQTSWIPHAREGHTLTTVGKQVVLYGGFGHSSKSDIAVYYPEMDKWRQPQMKGDVPLNERHGHSACEYQNCALIFGGEERVDAGLMFREFLNDTRAFYPDTGEWKYIPCIGKNIIPRRNHAAAIYDKFMYVYGGVRVDGEHLNDIWKLNLKNFVWTEVELGTLPKGIAYHCMCACYTETLSQIQKIRIGNRAYEEGLYVFGGKDNRGKITNTLKYLDPDIKNPVWKYPATKGLSPCERIHHTMIFYQPLGLLIIYGGKNGMLREREKMRDLNDIRILNLETMSWNASTSYGEVPKMTRTSHAASVYENVMIIFGGLGEREYMPNQPRLVELSQKNAERLINDYDQREKDTSLNHRASEFLPTFSEGSPMNFRRNDGNPIMKRTRKEEALSFLMPTPIEHGIENIIKRKDGRAKTREHESKVKNSFG